MELLGCICSITEKVADWQDGFCYTCKRKLSKKDWKELGKELDEERELKIKKLQQQRNKLNRQISSLKKENLKQ
jgi:hypothetical protein